jgi:hypothetical protein
MPQSAWRSQRHVSGSRTVPSRGPSVPNQRSIHIGHVGNPAAIGLHYLDVIRADLPASRRNRPTLAGMRPIEKFRIPTWNKDTCREFYLMMQNKL